MARSTPLDFLARERVEGRTVEEILALCQEQYEFVLADYDKAGDMEDHEYYGGLMEAYCAVLAFCTVDPDPDHPQKIA